MDRIGGWVGNPPNVTAVKRSVLLRSILVVVLPPLVLLGLVVSVAEIYGLVRYDPAYFTEAYTARYSTPTEVGSALESALQNGDGARLVELQGLRWPATFETSPDILWVMLWERTDRYLTYLYFDMQSLKAYPHYLEEVQGRWVVSPPDLYYYVQSGKYKSTFLLLALVWWASGAMTMAAVYLLSTSERLRARLYGE